MKTNDVTTATHPLLTCAQYCDIQVQSHLLLAAGRHLHTYNRLTQITPLTEKKK